VFGGGAHLDTSALASLKIAEFFATLTNFELMEAIFTMIKIDTIKMFYYFISISSKVSF